MSERDMSETKSGFITDESISSPLTDVLTEVYHDPKDRAPAHRNGAVAQAEAIARALSDTTNPNRFARDYVGPEFRCAPVPYAFLKRSFDLALSLSLLLLLLPLMALIALLVKKTSPGPVIFKQVRGGRGGRYFWCYKFRSMCADAEPKRAELMHLNEASGPVFKIKKDPRVTPIGSLLRRSSLDELPQLFNVLKGDMSLVGPRPPLPVEVATYGPRERGRLAVLPGLTCLWQVGGRSNIGFDQWVELDLLYIESMSFLNDIKIVCKTIPAVIRGSGAH
jgi:lipopolysaccharide/colanic/teichoic acid biosynthesis glycosyltransferase